jgi:hypothetical protein
LDIEPTDLPASVTAFTFEINPVNHPNFIIFSLAHGIDPQWWERLDHIGLRWLMDDILYSNFQPDAQGRQLPKSLERWIDRGERLGLLVYSSSSVKVDGKWGKAIAVAYAATVKGYEAAIDFVNEFKDVILTLCNGAKVSFQCFPSRNQAKGQRRQNEPITNFAKTSILKNHCHCNEIMNRAMLNNMMVSCKHLKAVALTLVKLPKKKVKTYNYGYAAQLILERSASTLARESSFFRKIFKGYHNLKSLFQQEIDEDTASDDGFTLVQSKKSIKNSQNNATSLKETFNMLSAHINATIDENGKYYIVIGGHGGRRSVNIYFKYKDGIYGAHYAFHGVSGAYIKSFNDINDAWAEIERRFPGVNSFETLRKFHEGIPDTETNMSPTWSEVDGETRHQFGSVAYTYTEADDADLLLKRMEATLRVTGSENGLVDQRSHYYASLLNPNKLYTGATEDEPFKPTGEQQPDSEKQYDDEEDYPHSQDYLANMEVQDNSTSQQDSTSTKSNRSLSPSKKRKVEGPESDEAAGYFDASILNTSKDSSNYDAVPIAVSLPMASVTHDFCCTLILSRLALEHGGQS